MRKATLEGDCVRRVRSSDARALRAAADVLLDGGVVAFPTETVYGLAVRCGDRAARTRLRRLKCREPAKPFQLLLASRRAALRLCPRMSALARALAHAFWPGPLTLVVRGPNGRWVGLRVPDHAVPRSLARRVGGALVATSANRTGARPARTAVEVEKALGDGVDLVLDDGRAPLGRPSSVVRVSGGEWELLREGALTESQIRDVTGTAPMGREQDT